MATPRTRAKQLLPLHDDAAPVMCTIGADEKADRIDLLNRLRTALTSIERTEHGLLLEFPRSDAVDADVRRFAADEKRCCHFWGFAVVHDHDTLVLRWDGPITAAPLLDTIDGVLRSGRPIESIDGLL